MQRDRQVLALSDGRTVGFAEYGDGKGRPVLALHGAPACRLMFAVADAAARTHGLRILAPDRPGYGLTPPDSSPTLSARTDWLVAVVDALGLRRFGVLGVSGGCPYAVSLAARLQDRIAALALVSPMGPVADYAASPDADRAPFSFLQDRFFLRLPQRTWLTHPVGDLLASACRHGPDLSARLFPRLAAAPDARILSQPDVMRTMREMTLEALRQGGGGSIADLEIYARPWGVPFADVTAPAVLWQGTADPIVPPQAAVWLARQLPRCTLHLVQGAGHFWVFEHVDAVLEALGLLMAENGLPPIRSS